LERDRRDFVPVFRDLEDAFLDFEDEGLDLEDDFLDFEGAGFLDFEEWEESEPLKPESLTSFSSFVSPSEERVGSDPSSRSSWETSSPESDSRDLAAARALAALEILSALALSDLALSALILSAFMTLSERRGSNRTVLLREEDFFFLGEGLFLPPPEGRRRLNEGGTLKHEAGERVVRMAVSKCDEAIRRPSSR
jgi:hypothetical protein